MFVGRKAGGKEERKGGKVRKKIFFSLEIGLIFNWEEECEIYCCYTWEPRI